MPQTRETTHSMVAGKRLTLLAAHVSGAPGVLAHGCVSIIDQRVFSGAFEAGTDHVAALGRLAPPPNTLFFGGVVDESVTLRAIERIAVVDRI